jgi:putative two-component system hydrogenase maturation factor HypX/HoxX
LGLVGHCLDISPVAREPEVTKQALTSTVTYNLTDRILQRQQVRADDEATRPVADYRKEGLSRMHCNFYGFDPSYHVARYHIVCQLFHTWTPRHLAVHRP